LVAASGLAGVTYSNHEPEDVWALLEYLRAHATELGIDDQRLGVWACSGNVTLALAVLMREAPDAFRCAALSYGLTLDSDGHTAVADFWAQFGRTSPCAGRSIADLPVSLPLLLVRAGQDQVPGLNATLDRFVAAALTRNLPVTLINYPRGPHAFDLTDDGEESRAVIRQILSFLQRHLA
jgi:acetyl esterase/lipase